LRSAVDLVGTELIVEVIEPDWFEIVYTADGKPASNSG
jgi:hypothetical protein